MNVLEVEGLCSRLLENFIATVGTCAFAYVYFPNVCCWWLIWKVFDVFILVYTLLLVAFAFVPFAFTISFILIVFVFVASAYWFHVNDIRLFRVTIYWARNLTFFFQLVLISWMVTLCSCLFWQIIDFILPLNEYSYVYAWTTPGNIAILLWKLW